MLTFGNIEQSKRNLPHWHCDCALQFITFHLADSLPESVRNEISREKDIFLANYPEPWTPEVAQEYNSKFTTKINDYLDAGYGSCVFTHRECAKIMEDILLHFNNRKYILHHYVVMPNHVHVLAELLPGFRTSEICKSWKSYSANIINKFLGRKGRLWHQESWDRMIRNARHYASVVSYIDKNIHSGGIAYLTRK